MITKKAAAKINGKLVVMLALLALLGYAVFVHFNTRSRLRNDGYWTNGIIIKEESGYRGNLKFLYEFYVGNNKLRGDVSGIAFSGSAGRYFINKSFPVVYYSNNPGLNKMLMAPNDFKFCDRDFPDSLKWVLRYLK